MATATEQQLITGYHFTSNTLRDGSPIPPVGEWLRHDGPIVPCKSGLHMSEHPSDALTYAPGPTLHRVVLRGDLKQHGGDKWAGRERRILASIDATDLLRRYARWCALQVVDLWDAPKVVADYLQTGDESLRLKAQDAARAAALAAWEAAWAVEEAARTAKEAEWAAARATALAAKCGAAGTAEEAAESAAWAAGAAALAAKGAAWRKQRARLLAAVEEAFGVI